MGIHAEGARELGPGGAGGQLEGVDEGQVEFIERLACRGRGRRCCRCRTRAHCGFLHGIRLRLRILAIVEEVSAAGLRAGSARHPYTQALLAAGPRLEAPGRDTPHGPLATIPGRPPAPADRPTGCAFAARCPRALARCTTELPPLIDAVACHAVAEAATAEGDREVTAP